MSDLAWQPQFSRWRHGGWYVENVHYPHAVGCVSRNYPDRKWRIVCDKREGDHVYPTRDAAARAEREIARAESAEHADRVGMRFLIENAQFKIAGGPNRLALYVGPEVRCSTEEIAASASELQVGEQLSYATWEGPSILVTRIA